MQHSKRKQTNQRHLLTIAGLDPSLSNWGVVKGTLDIIEGYFDVDSLHLIHPDKNKKTKMRQNSKDVLSAQQLYKGNIELLQDVDIVIAELPTGSQSARASAAYGICMGIVGALTLNLDNFIQVTPMDVKKVVGNNNPAKSEMIDWAVDMHPDANWPLYKRDKSWYISEAKAEHMADALAAIYAGAETKQFLNLINQYKDSL